MRHVYYRELKIHACWWWRSSHTSGEDGSNEGNRGVWMSVCVWNWFSSQQIIRWMCDGLSFYYLNVTQFRYFQLEQRVFHCRFNAITIIGKTASIHSASSECVHWKFWHATQPSDRIAYFHLLWLRWQKENFSITCKTIINITLECVVLECFIRNILLFRCAIVVVVVASTSSLSHLLECYCFFESHHEFCNGSTLFTPPITSLSLSHLSSQFLSFLILSFRFFFFIFYVVR